MTKKQGKFQFQTALLRPLQSGDELCWLFVILPKQLSEKLPRRGRTSVEGTINNVPFMVTLDPDGQLSHWLKISKKLQQEAGVSEGDFVSFEVKSVEKEPEPEVPIDFQNALAVLPEAQTVWSDTTTIARVDWIHWITSAKQTKTRTKRISDACNMLSSGKRRVCCFDSSGFYSKAFSAPETEEC